MRKTVRHLVVQLMSKGHKLTTEEIADRVDRPYCSVQPTVSNLFSEGWLNDTGERGTTKYGKPCIVWQWQVPDQDDSPQGRLF